MAQDQSGSFKPALGALLIVSMASGAAAQTGDQLQVPPKPKDIDLMGDPDAACVMGAVDSYGRITKGAKDLAEEKRNELLEISMRQLAFYAGKLTARMDVASGEQSVNTASKVYTRPNTIPDFTPIVVWCFRSYLEVIRTTFATRIRAAEGLNKGKKPAELPAIDPLGVPHDAMCFALVSRALPATKEAAKTNPKAQGGVNDLARTQHYFIGKMTTNPDNAAVESQLAQAFLFGDQVYANGDEATARKYGMDCIDEYRKITTMIIKAGKSDWKPSRPD